MSLDQPGAQTPSVRAESSDLDYIPKSMLFDPRPIIQSMSIRERLYPREQELAVLVRHCVRPS